MQKDQNPYADILYLPHHVSSHRAHMSMVSRGAQFSPFAALTGFESAIAETQRLTDSRPELSEGGNAILDEKIRFLIEQQNRHPRITATVFLPDERKAGGDYQQVSGTLKRVDTALRVLLFQDGRKISLEEITDFSSEELEFPEL